MEKCIQDVSYGLSQLSKPVLTQDGTSGTYLMRHDSKIVGIFKPIDEEPFAPNNPRGMKGPFGSETCRPGVKSGESTIREISAYLLDH